MASSNKNSESGVVVPSLIAKLTRGRNYNLGAIAAAGDVVTFTIPEPSRDHQGSIVIQVNPGTLTLGAGTFALEVSIDTGLSWATVPAAMQNPLTLTGQPGADTATLFMAQYQLAGFGAGAIFRFGFVVAPTSGSAPVWVLCG